VLLLLLLLLLLHLRPPSSLPALIERFCRRRR
jgi:hypothetical protein